LSYEAHLQKFQFEGLADLAPEEEEYALRLEVPSGRRHPVAGNV
jgi:hypothetical protein